MESKPMKFVHWFILAAMLLCAAAGNVLLFARGLGSASLIYDARPYLCVLPFGICFFVYVAAEAIGLFAFKPGEPSFAFPQGKHDLTVKITLIVSAIAFVGALVGAIVLDNHGEALWATVVMVVGAPIGGLAYLGLSLFQAIQSKKAWRECLILAGYILFLIAIEAVALAMTLSMGIDWAFI